MLADGMTKFLSGKKFRKHGTLLGMAVKWREVLSSEERYCQMRKGIVEWEEVLSNKERLAVE